MNLADNYLGSGKRLQDSFQKYGKENFEKEILFIFETEVEMNNKEKELVTEEFCKDSSNYNLCEGGKGGFGFINTNIDLSERNRNTNAKRDYSSEEYRTNLSTSLSGVSRNTTDETKRARKELQQARRILSKLPTARDNQKKKFKEIRHQQGENNSQYGKKFKWITNDIINIRLNLDLDIPEGFRQGISRSTRG